MDSVIEEAGFVRAILGQLDLDAITAKSTTSIYPSMGAQVR